MVGILVISESSWSHNYIYFLNRPHSLIFNKDAYMKLDKLKSNCEAESPDFKILEYEGGEEKKPEFISNYFGFLTLIPIGILIAIILITRSIKVHSKIM